jgi:hypothetical protein
MKALIAAVLCATLVGCATTKDVVIKEVKVPVPVPCNITVPDEPAYPYTDQPLTGDEYSDTKHALAEIEIRKGYTGQLLAGIGACNKRDAI